MIQDNKTQSKIVETYAQDMAQVIEDDKTGLIKKIIHEEEEHEIEKKNLSPESKKNKLFMFLSFLLILTGVIILFYFILVKESPTVSIEKQFIPLIFTDKSVLIEVSGLKKDMIEQKVRDEISNTLVKSGGLEGIYLTLNKTSIGFKKFIEIINGNFTSAGSNFVDDNFLMGVVKNSNPTDSNNFFILLKVRSMADIFDAIRDWEKKMFYDLHGFFGIDVAPDTKYLLTKSFEDGVVGNKNARVLYDQDTKIVMMYILANDNSVIITNTESAGQEIMRRLASGRIKK